MSPSPRVWVALVALTGLARGGRGGWGGSSPSPPTAVSISVENGGPWGEWGDPEFCPEGSHATGFQLKVEPPQGFFGDDTALNGVRLLCDGGGTATSSVGPRGSWSPPLRCGRPLVSFRLRVEPPWGPWDDAAATDLAAACAGGGAALGGAGAPRGAWGGWSPPCPPAWGVCGLRSRLEPPRGPGDDTGLNSVEFFCCP